MAVKSHNARYKHQLVAADLIRRIQKGEWRIGAKIPSIDDLTEMYPFSRMTVFNAVESLVQDGYIETRRGVGAFVLNDRIMGLIGLVIGEEVLHPQQTPMAFMLYQHLRRQLEEKGYRTKLYIDTSPGNPDIPRELLDDLNAGRLSGLITASCDTTLALAEWAEFGRSALPWVDFTGHEVDTCKVVMNRESFFKLFADYVLANDRRRVGCLIADDVAAKALKVLADEHGLETRDEWVVRGTEYSGDFEQVGFSQMLQLWDCAERPDTLLVCDDIACKGVTQAILKLGISVPDELAVVSAANRDSQLFYPVPVVRIEYDIEDCARKLVDMLLGRLLRATDIPQESVLYPTLSEGYAVQQ
jgi:DNA-binding LacI/PurR family transcriptional regulator